MHHDAREPAAAENLGPLPEWDLGDLYASPHASELNADTEWLRGECLAFAARLRGQARGARHRGAAGGDPPLRADRDGVGPDHELCRACATTRTPPTPMRAKFFGDTQAALTEITTPLVFFTLELNRIDDAALDAVVAGDPALARYKPVLDRIRKMKPYQLSDELEKFLHDQSVVGAAAWNRLFDETMAGLEIPVGGETLSLEATLDLLSDSDRARRQAAAEALAATFAGAAAALRADHQHARQGEGDRGPLAQVPDAADRRGTCRTTWSRRWSQALRDAVVAAYPRLSHRYYALKAKWLGLDKLQVWDRNAPLPQRGRPQDRLGGGEGDGARRLCRLRSAHGGPGASRSSSGAGSTPGVKPGKAPGAFAHPTVVDVHPYVLLNYLGKSRDVMTLAHELGHGVHQRLAAGQGELLASTPLTLAETASVFGEMLTFRRLLDAGEGPGDAQDPARLEGRGHDQHRGAADRLLRLRVPAARRAAQGRADARGHQRASGWRCRPRASGRRSSSCRATRRSGPTSRTSSTRRSTSMPTPSATGW